MPFSAIYTPLSIRMSDRFVIYADITKRQLYSQDGNNASCRNSPSASSPPSSPVATSTNSPLPALSFNPPSSLLDRHHRLLIALALHPSFAPLILPNSCLSPLLPLSFYRLAFFPFPRLFDPHPFSLLQPPSLSFRLYWFGVAPRQHYGTIHGSLS